MYLTYLASVLKDAGLSVVEIPGWQTRGHGEMAEKVKLIMCHHTAESVDEDKEPSLQVITYGRKDLSGPLCNLGLGQNGTYYVVAAGKAYHAGKGSWPGILDGSGESIGIEAENNGIGEPWPEVQMNAYARGCAALCKHLGLSSDAVIGHKEWAPNRKIDPNFDMDLFRKEVIKYL